MSVQPTSKDFNTLHQTARKYAEAGIPIFPVIPRKPPHGHLDASADLAQIDAWWTENPATTWPCAPQTWAGRLSTRRPD